MSCVIGGEGPSIVAAVVTRLVLLQGAQRKGFALSLLVSLGVPLTHSGLVTVTAALLAVRRGGGVYKGFSPGERRMVLFPPIMLWRVASLLWPGAGLLQVADV